MTKFLSTTDGSVHVINNVNIDCGLDRHSLVGFPACGGFTTTRPYILGLLRFFIIYVFSLSEIHL